MGKIDKKFPDEATHPCRSACVDCERESSSLDQYFLIVSKNQSGCSSFMPQDLPGASSLSNGFANLVLDEQVLRPAPSPCTVESVVLPWPSIDVEMSPSLLHLFTPP